MLESFIKTTEKGLNEMQVAAMDQRWESVADLSHKIQSPCRHIGATDLYNLLNKIEKAIRNNERPATIESDTRDALSEYAFISRLINEHIAKMS
jgi:HPt (histidine-containing phosphotransfer) domain-containing protein